MSSHVIGELTTRSIERVVEWQFEELNLLNARNEQSFYSPSFSFAQSTFVLRIYAVQAETPPVEQPDDAQRSLQFGLYLAKLAPTATVKLSAGLDLFLSNNRMKCIELNRAFVTKKSYGSMFLKFSDIPTGTPGATARVICKVRDLEFPENKNTFPTLLEDIKSLYNKKECCDVRIIVQGQDFWAHKAILIARSPVFASTFKTNMRERSTGILRIADCKPSAFRDFLYFIYCDEVDRLCQQNVFNLFSLSDKYDVHGLREICVKYMKDHLSVDTFCTTLSFAMQHGDSVLTDFAKDYFSKNAENIIVSPEWEQFTSENPMLSISLLTSAVLVLSSKK